MTLALTFALLALGLTAFLWAGAAFAQPYLYSEAADRLGLRALVGGVIIAAFLTFWTYANTRASHPGKYDTFFEFNPVATQEAPGFDAVRRLNRKGPDGKFAEETVPYMRAKGSATRYVEAKAADREFRTNTSDWMTVAVLVPDPKDPAAKARFDAGLTPDGSAYRADGRVFREARGSRYMDAATPGVVYAPSTLAVVGAVLLNLLVFGVWFVALWPVLRFTSGVALGLAFGFGLLTMLVAMPMLFEANRVPPSPPPAAAGG